MGNSIGAVLIGNYLEPIISLLSSANINVDMVISTCSNLAMEGKSDLSILKRYLFTHTAQRDIFASGSIINMFKDLSKRISRDPQDFGNTFRFVGDKKRMNCNKSDYVVIMNTSMGYTVYEHNGSLYSDTYPQNKFIRDIKEQKEYIKFAFPFPDEFNWKYYYDKFIDAILSAYDSEHIILIRTNAAQWYTDGSEIKAFNDISLKFRNRIQQIDDYFMERTCCKAVNEHYCFIPPVNKPCAFTYAVMDEMAYRNISDSIQRIIDGDHSFEDEAPHCIHPFAKRIIRSFTSDAVKNNLEVIGNIGKVISTLEHGNNDFLNTIKILNIFIAEENYRLSDYVFDNLRKNIFKLSDEDFEIFNAYTKYMKLDVNDIIAIYVIYVRSENKKNFKKIIKNIIENADCIPIKNALRTKEKNMNVLRNYPYIESEIILGNDESVYIFLNEYHYIKITADTSTMMEYMVLNHVEKVDFFNIKERGYVCSLPEAKAIASSLEFFILKNKWGDKDRPIIIRFESLEEFAVTLFSTDYERLLNNENFVFIYEDNQPDLSDMS